MAHMQICIEPDDQLPVYTQLKKQIKFLILSGELQPGTQLPTSRQLAGFLNINRNTVLKAYQELVREDLIVCKRGGGCKVVERPAATGQPVSSRLLKVIDGAIEEASELGVDPDDFASMAYARAKQRRDIQAKRRLIFVECERSSANSLARRIQQEMDLEVTPLVLRELERPTPQIEQALQEADVIATTFFHIEELKELLRETNKKVVALLVKPHLDALIEIAGIAKGTSVLLVCMTKHCAAEMQHSLDDAGIKGLDYSLAGVTDRRNLAEEMPKHPVVIASNWAARQVLSMAGPDQRAIVLDYLDLDEAGIYMLQSLIGEESLTV